MSRTRSPELPSVVVVPDIQPPELAALLDLAERPRSQRWSLRAALTRYAQGQPQRAADLLELVRRILAALGPVLPTLEREGAERWGRLQAGADDGDVALGLLRSLLAIDEAGDALAVWAGDPWNQQRPDAEVDAVLAEVTARLESLGVPKEERPARPPGGRRRG